MSRKLTQFVTIPHLTKDAWIYSKFTALPQTILINRNIEAALNIQKPRFCQIRVSRIFTYKKLHRHRIYQKDKKLKK